MAASSWGLRWDRISMIASCVTHTVGVGVVRGGRWRWSKAEGLEEHARSMQGACKRPS